MTDLKFAIRQLLKHKGSSALAVLILALGIGGTTAVYSVADKALLHPIPGRDTDRLVSVREVDVNHDSHWQVSPPLIEELALQTNLIDSVTYCFQGPEEKKLITDGRTVKARGAKVAPNFFDLLELRPLLGRTFAAADGAPGAARVVVIGSGLWQDRFGGNPKVIGRFLKLDGEDFTIVGVMPANVQFPFGSGYSQFWLPHAFTSDQLNSDWAPKDRMWETLVKTREGVGLSKLQSLLDVLADRRAKAVDEGTQRWSIQATPASLIFAGPAIQNTVWGLLAMMGTFLFIACVNIGNLSLGRVLARRGEIGVRMAIGAGRGRIARQLFVESLLLATLGAAFGLFAAWTGIVVLEKTYLTALPRINAIGLDWRVLGYTIEIALAAALVFGTVPSLIAASANVNHVLKESAQQHSGGILQKLFQDGLVVIQVCVAVVLLAGAFSMTQSVVNALRTDPGLNPEGLYRVYYDALDFMNSKEQPYDVQAAIKRGVPREQAIMEAFRASTARLNAFRRIALERLRAVPGIESAAVNCDSGFSDYKVDGQTQPVYLGRSSIDVIDGDYLRTVGAKLVTGRLLNQDDGRPGEQGVVINEAMAAACWPGENPLGKRFHRTGEFKEDYQVIGVIRNIRDYQYWYNEAARPVDSKSKPSFYVPYERVTDSFSGGVGDYVIRSSVDDDELRPALVEAGNEMLAPVELRDFYSIQSQLYRSTAPRRVMMWLLLSLGALGLLLSALGLYAVLSFAVNRRTREVGIRMAVGATRSQVWRFFFRRGIRLVLNGVVLGAALVVGLAQYVKALLYGVPLATPWVLVLVALTILLIGGITCWIPAKRASLLDPMNALRTE